MHRFSNMFYSVKTNNMFYRRSQFAAFTTSVINEAIGRHIRREGLDGAASQHCIYDSWNPFIATSHSIWMFQMRNIWFDFNAYIQMIGKRSCLGILIQNLLKAWPTVVLIPDFWSIWRYGCWFKMIWSIYVHNLEFSASFTFRHIYICSFKNCGKTAPLCGMVLAFNEILIGIFLSSLCYIWINIRLYSIVRLGMPVLI